MNPNTNVPKTEKLQVLVDGKPVEIEVFPSAPGSAREIVARLPDGRMASFAATAQTLSKLLHLAGAQIQSKLPVHAMTKSGYRPGARTAFEERIRALLKSSLIQQVIREGSPERLAGMRALELVEQAVTALDDARITRPGE